MGHTVISGTVEGLAAAIAKPTPANKFIELLGQVGGSSTAQMIASFMDSAKEDIGILIIDDGFDSMYIPPSVLSGAPALAKFTGGVAVLNIKSPMSIRGTPIPLGVSLMHELGHAKQYVEKPQWFENTYAAAMKVKSGKNVPKLEIEDDNLKRHEAPICQELGLPFRLNYD